MKLGQRRKGHKGRAGGSSRFQPGEGPSRVFSVIVELKLGKCPHLCALVEVVAAGLRLGVGSVAARAAAAEGADGVDAEAVRAQIRAQRALVNIPPQRTQTLVHTQLPANIDNFWLVYLYQNNHLFRKYPSQN